MLIENPAVSLTGCLLEVLTEKKIRVIFCDAKRNPNAELVPYFNSYDCSRKIKAQIAWSDDMKGVVWSDIVAEKIRKQANFLEELEKFNEAGLLRSYLSLIEPHDITNREGHSAKVYFNALFGMDFTDFTSEEKHILVNVLNETVMINMRTYFSDEEMERFSESVRLHDFKVLLLESSSLSKLKNAKRYTVDADLCEF